MTTTVEMKGLYQGQEKMVIMPVVVVVVVAKNTVVVLWIPI